VIHLLLAALALAAPSFDYDASAPLEVREAAVIQERGVVVHDLSFAAPSGERVPAYLVLPPGDGPFPAALAAPGSGGGRDAGLGDGVELARRGIAVLTIDPPNTRPGHRGLFACSDADRNDYVEYVKELRRGLDLLAARPEIDRARLGYTGFSYGAAVGGTLVGVDHRLKAVVLQSGSGRLSTLAGPACKPRLSKSRLAAYVRGLRDVDPVGYVGRAAPAALLLQNGRNDYTYPRRDVLALHRAASAPKTIRWYRTTHGLSAAALVQRDDWLVAHI